VNEKRNNQPKVSDNSQSRPTMILLSVLGGTVIVILISYLMSALNLFGDTTSVATIGGTPDIESIPGVGDPSVEYSRLIAEQNKAEVERAVKEDGSSLPTIIRPQYSLATDDFDQQYTDKNRIERDVDRCSLENLVKARKAGVSASELKCYGCTLEDLRAAGYTAADLRAAGFSAEELKAAGFSAEELRAAGFSASDLRAAGFSAKELLSAGYSVSDLAGAGFTPEQLLAAGASIADLKNAGIDVNALLASGVGAVDLIKSGFCADGVLNAVSNPNTLRDEGVEAPDLYNSGVPISQLVELGYSAQDIIYSGASVSEMIANGVDASELRRANVSKKDISFAEKNLSQVPGGTCTADYAVAQFNAGVQAKVLLPLGCSPSLLRDAGFTARDLVRENVTAGRLRAAGYTASNLVAAGLTLDMLVEACYSAQSLLDAGFSASDLLKAGISPSELLATGLSVKELALSGVDCASLYKGGASLSELFDLGCTAEELKAAGASAAELLAAGYSVSQLKAAGFSAEDLLSAGADPAELVAAGFSITDLLNAGLTEGQLIRAGVSSDRIYGSAGEEQGIGCSVERINIALSEGSTVADLLEKGCSVDSLVKAGISVSELLAAGASVEDLLKAGVSVNELLAAGVSVSDLLDAGASVSDLLAAGVTVEQLVRAGASAKDMLAAGITVAEMKAAGMSIDGILESKPDARSLYLAGIDLNDLKGYTRDELNEAGYNVQDDIFLDEPSAETDMERIQRLQNETMEQQDRERRILQLAGAMQAQATSLFSTWDNAPRQSVNVGSRKPGDYIMASEAIQNAEAEAYNSSVVKAGTIMYASLDSAINSDAEEPILATIVSGPLKGSKVLGEFKQEEEKLVLKFETINMPNKRNTTDITLFAVDVNTTRNVTVDSHYILKYGSLFAASFLEGLNTAAGTIGTEVTTTDNSTVIKEGSLDRAKVIAAGLGKVGENLVDAAKSYQDKKPTIRMKVGATFGILVMEDFTVNNLS